MVIRSVTTGTYAQGRTFGQGLFFQFKIGVEIHLGGFNGFMTKPEGDHGAVHAVLKEVHCCGMAEHMRPDLFPFKRWALLSGSGCVFGKQVFDSVAAQGAAPCVGKQWGRWDYNPG